MPKGFFLTTPIFYVNGPPHIGHAYTVVAADVLARAHRQRGAPADQLPKLNGETSEVGGDVFFLTGTDEHGTKIAEAAKAAGKEPQQFADEIAGTFKAAWQALDIQYDDFIRTTEPRHVQGVLSALRVLHDGGHLYEKSYRGLYCAGCESFLTAKDLNGAGQCPLHNRKPEEVEEKNWFFKLSSFLPEIRRRIEASGRSDLGGERSDLKALRILPVERKNEVLGLLGRRVFARSGSDEAIPTSSAPDSSLRVPSPSRGEAISGAPAVASSLRGSAEAEVISGSAVADFSISRPASRVPWAIPLPFDSSQTCYVWVDALLNYVTAFGYGRESPYPLPPTPYTLEKFWPADLHLIGLDILKFHAIYWPAILLALGLDLPKEIFVHGFFTVNGQKISKSLGNAIDPQALVERYGSDATRYLLLSQFPFGASGDVQVSRFDEQYTAILANTIGNLVSRVITLVQKLSDGKVPDAEPDQSVFAILAERGEAIPSSAAVVPSLRGSAEAEAISGSAAVASSLRAPSPSRGEAISGSLDSLVNTPVRLAQSLNAYADRTAPWKESNPQKRAVALRTLVDGVAHLSLSAEPLLPRTSAAIQKAFSVEHGKPPPAESPIRPTDPPILFPRLQ